MLNINVVHVKDFGTKSKEIKAGEIYVYCGRPSRLGNPYVMKNEKDREGVIFKFEQNLPLPDIQELHRYCKNKNTTTLHLGCYCAPKACHCDIIKKELIKLESDFNLKIAIDSLSEPQKSSTIEFVNGIKTQVKDNNIDCEICFDHDGSLCIVCVIEDENKLLSIISDLKMPADFTVFVGSNKNDIISTS